MTERISLSKDSKVQLPVALLATFLACAVVCGGLWASLNENVSINTSSLKAHTAIIEDLKERVFSVEVRFEMILEKLREIKEKLNAPNSN